MHAVNPFIDAAGRAGPWRGAAGMALAAAALATALMAGHARAAENGPGWQQLSRAEQQALTPLQSQWGEIDAVRKQKWRQIAQRYPGLPPEQQARIRERMVEWARMTTAERNAARLRYQAAKALTASERQARWDQYQALSNEQRRALAGRAQRRTDAPAPRPPRAAAVAEVQPKSNIVPPPAPPTATRNKAVAPGTVQAAVGATTRPITQRPVPPKHQQAGQPKIAATPEFVDRATLLPQRGPQAALGESGRASQ